MSTEEASPVRMLHSSPKVSVVGIGGAGNNLLARAIGSGVSPARCVAVNTDDAELSESPARNKVLMSSLASSPARNRENFHTSLDVTAHRVTPLVDGSTFAILLAGLGGSLGTSAGPLIAQLTRTPNRLVVSMVALPYLHERERRFVALRGLKQMAKASNCTVIVDNAADNGFPNYSDRISDERTSIAVKSLAEYVSNADPEKGREAIDVMSLGPIATVCTRRIASAQSIQKSVMEALKRPSADLPFNQAKGAILLLNSSKRIDDGEAALAYETLSSIIGKNVRFVYGSVRTGSDPTLCIFLTGYSYDLTIRSLVDFVELYDVEYGQALTNRLSGLEVPLFQMERP